MLSRTFVTPYMHHKQIIEHYIRHVTFATNTLEGDLQYIYYDDEQVFFNGEALVYQ